MRALLIGFGEIGEGVHSILSNYHEIAIYDKNKAIEPAFKDNVEVLLVAIPWFPGHYDIEAMAAAENEPGFIDTIKAWQEEINPKATIVFSTVPIGTCKYLGAVHFPIEAKHPHIKRDLLLNRNCFMGGHNQIAEEFMQQAEFKFQVLDKPEHTEFLKLRSTAIYGVNLEFARYCGKIAKELDLDYDNVIDYDKAYNILVMERGTYEHVRYVLTPPEGMIGGHCVVPNAEILNRAYPSPFLGEIIKKK
ncbi:MAG: hypothetical protein PHG66_05930 [Candidatus Colwellbacteria bacterium]|nr:hypothetical protein [Candidatus Colwellbacteria bacterium]